MAAKSFRNFIGGRDRRARDSSVETLTKFRTHRKRKEKAKLKDIENHVVVRWAPQWRQLGRQLNIEDHQMSIIEHDHPNNCVECCSKMLSDWLEQNTTNHATWEVLISAIDKLPEAVCGIGEDISTTISDTAESLCTQYISNKVFTAEDGWFQYQPKHYTALAIIHNKTTSSSTAAVIPVKMKLTVSGNIVPADSVSKRAKKTARQSSRETKGISDIFTPIEESHDNPCITLVEGAPGIGKTALAKEIAIQWANKQLLSSKELLFLVFLREFNSSNINSIKDFVQYAVKNRSKTDECLEHYLCRSNGKSLVIVLDGYDEMSEEDRNDSLIADIIQRKVFPRCCLVITSRPTACSHLHNLVDCRVEIIGFTEEDRLDYIQTALQGNDDQVRALYQYLQSNPTINALCYIPLNMTILLCLAEDGVETLPKTQTDVYEKFIGMTIKRFIKKGNEQNAIKSVVSNATLPSPCDDVFGVFKELAQLAFKGLQTDKLVFTLAEIKSSCPNLTVDSISRNGLGLLKAIPFFNKKTCTEDVTFRFLHFSIQEYMAAYYISMLSDQKQIKLLQKTFWEHRYYNTWIMYVGITGAASFALRHFLSGNTLQLITKLHSSFSISDKMLKDKVKCLHLIQCLEESKNEDVTRLLRNFLQGQEIDLGNQTLLPSDLNTIGFFLCRSATKNWEAITLSKCNIGSTGCDALCNRFLDKERCNIVRVRRVDFSHNQLNLSCLIRLFELFKSWHTSEVIITDDAILSDTSNNNLFTKIEETFVESHFSDTINIFLLGTFLYTKMSEETRILEVLSSCTNLKAIYLMHSKWDPDATVVQEWYIALKQQSIETLRVIGMDTSKSFIAALASILSSIHKPFSMFVYDPFLSNSIATAVVDASSSTQSISECLRLVISSGGIWGVFNTNSLGSHLSYLELFNLSVCIRCFNHLQVSPWKTYLQTCSNKHINKFVMNSFIDHIAFSNSCKCQLQVVLRENNTLFASKADVRDIDSIINCDDNLLMTLCKCDLTLMQYDSIASHCTTLCIVKSRLGDAIIELLCTRLIDKQCLLQELFVQDTSNVNVIKLDALMNSRCHSASVLLVTNDLMIGHNPTAKQIALALQLEPSITTWKLPNCRVTADVFYQLTSWLTTVPNNWTELDFEGCNITDTECEIIHQSLKCNNHPFSVNTLAIPVDQLPTSIMSKLVEIVILWKIQKLTLYNTNPIFYKELSERLVCLTGIHEKVHLYISSKICKLWFFFNTDLWYEVIMLSNRFSELYLINCNIPAMKLNSILHHLNKKCNKLSRIFATNSTLSQAVIMNLIRNYRNKRIELSVCLDADITDHNAMYDLLSGKNMPYSGLKLALLTGKYFYSCNITQQQLQLVHHVAHTNHVSVKCHLMEGDDSLSQKEVFTTPKHRQLEVVHLVGKEFQVLHASQIVTLLNKNTTLKVLRVDNYNITDGATNVLKTVLLQNEKLEEIHFHQNNFEMNNTNRIMKTLQTLSSITRLYFSNNYVTDEVVDSMVDLVSQNIYLQDIDLSNCGLTALNSLKIISALSEHTSLKVLQMANCNINNAVAKLLAGILHSNQQLQRLDLSGNNFQAADCAVISREVQHISKLSKLSLSNNSITDEAASDIAAFLCDKTQLNELYLSSNCLNALSVHKISVALKNSSTLKKFYMGNNNIDNEAVNDIADLLSHNTELQELELEVSKLDSRKISDALQYTSTLLKLTVVNSHVTSESADGIAAVLSHNTLLQDLTLDGNFLQGTGTKIIFNHLQNTSTLVKLSIQDNHCTDDAAEDIAQVISHNTGLQELNLQGNDLQTTGAIVVTKALQKLSLLIRLNIADNEICDAASNDLMAVLLNNIQLQYFSFDKNKFTAKGSATIQDFYIRKRYGYIIYNSRNK